MKNQHILPWVFLLLFSYRAETQETVTVSTGEWAPYTTGEDEFHGAALHIVSAAFQAVGLEVGYPWYPWARAMHEAEVSNTDFSGIRFCNEGRESGFDYTDPVVSSVNVFSNRKDNDFDWTDYDSFPQGKPVGRTISCSYGEEFDEAVKTGRISTDDARNDTLNFRKLIRGRIDAFAVTYLVELRPAEESVPLRDGTARYPPRAGFGSAPAPDIGQGEQTIRVPDPPVQQGHGNAA